jgi:hypothetical protein
VRASALPPIGLIQDEAIADALRYLDAHYAWIYDGKSYLLVKGYNVALQHDEWRTSTLASFREFYRAWRVGAGNTTCSIADLWLKDGDHRRFREITFDPSGRHASHVFNLWQGFAITPQAGSWAAIQEHVYEVVCGGNADYYDWLMNWCARLVQQPSHPAGTAIVLRGKPGAGKSLLWRALAAICGPHAAYVSHAGSLTSRFNGILAGCLFLHADEVVWGGDIIGANYLKGTLTEPTIAIERKGHEVIHVKNCLHVVMNSNETHVARVEGGDRRYAVFDVPATYAGQNRSYFAPLYASLQNGAPAALLYDLLARDLTSFDPFVPPATAARAEQQLRTLPPAEAWLVESARRGDLAGVEFGQRVKVSEVYGDYIRTMERRGMNRRSSETELGILLAKTLPTMQRRRSRLQGTVREYCYDLPALPQARESIAAALSLSVEWPADPTDED